MRVPVVSRTGMRTGTIVRSWCFVIILVLVRNKLARVLVSDNSNACQTGKLKAMRRQIRAKLPNWVSTIDYGSD
eukprot:scaffold170919_cov13-Prasinocladus_malaysianus.AAC.1